MVKADSDISQVKSRATSVQLDEVSDSDDELLFEKGDFSKTYLAKSKLVSKAIDEIGFGKYQLCLFCVAGLGYFNDNSMPIATSLILLRLVEVDGVHAPVGKSPYLTLAQNLGLLVGAFFWSLSADIIGRRWAFNLTFLITGAFCLVAGASPNFAAIGVFDAFWSSGVGGNLPIDLTLFIESLPTSKRWLLPVMTIWWALGQLVANLLSWALISNFSCDDTSTECLKENNKGWRYFLFTLGGLTLVFFLARLAFDVQESPAFHLARGRDDRAVAALENIARINKTSTDITIEDFQKIDSLELDGEPIIEHDNSHFLKNELLMQKLAKFDLSHIKQCFHTPKLAYSSTLVILTWSIIGLAFPLYNAFLPTYLEQRGNANKPLSVSETYRNSLIVAVVAIPACILAGFMVELRIGRKGTLSISLALTGVVLFCSTTAKTSNAYLGWNCAFSFVSAIMYGVLYAYTPEIFPTTIRGTGYGLSSSGNRLFGVFAPLIAIYADLTTAYPIYISGALFFLAAILSVLFPYESRNKLSI